MDSTAVFQALDKLPPRLYSLLYYAAVALVVHLIVSILLRRSFTSFKIGSVGWLALGNIEWRSKAGITVKIRNVGVTYGGPASQECGRRGWIVLKIRGVDVKIPKRLAFGSATSPAVSKPTKSPVDDARPRSATAHLVLLRLVPAPLRLFLARLFRFIRARIVRPIIMGLSDLGGRLSGMVSLLAVEVDVRAEIEDVVVVAGLVRVGGSLVGGRNPTINAWLGMRNFSVRQSCDALAAVEMPALLAVTCAAPMDSSIGLASIINSRGGCIGLIDSCVDVVATLGSAEHGLHIRAQQLQQILVQLNAADSEYGPTSRPTPVASSPSPLHHLRSLAVTLPHLTLSADYSTILPAVAPQVAAAQSFAFDLCLKGLSLNLLVGGLSDNIVEKDHYPWLGRGRELGCEARVAWESVTSRIGVEGESDLDSSSQFLALGHSSLALTSTFVPTGLRRVAAPAQADFNDNLVILSAHLGRVTGRSRFATFDTALRIFCSQAPVVQPNKPSVTQSPLLRGLPRIIAAGEWDGAELNSCGPERPLDSKHSSRRKLYHPWSSEDSVCIELAQASASFCTEYSDRSMHRTAADHKAMLKEVRDVEAQEASNADSSATLPTPSSTLVPPPLVGPPPAKARRARVISPPDLHQFPLQLVSHCSLSSSPLRIYIESHPTDAGNLGHFPLLSAGPLSATASSTLLGSIEIDVDDRAVAILDRTQQSGQVGVELNTVDLQLWQPIVQSCVRDFLQSLTTAASLAPLPPTPVPSAPFAPLVDTLPLDISFYLSLHSITCRIAGIDPRAGTKAVRGVVLESGAVVLEYFQQRQLRPLIINYPHRQLLDLREDIRVEANAVVAESPAARQALLKCSALGFHLNPITSATDSERAKSRKVSVSAGEQTDEDWELKNRGYIGDSAKRRQFVLHTRVAKAAEGIVDVPEIDFRLRLGAAEPPALDVITLSIESEHITLHGDILHVYLCLVAASAILQLVPERSPRPAASVVVHRPPPLITVKTEVVDVHLFLTLPKHIKLFGQVRRVRIIASLAGIVAEWDSLLIAGTCPTSPKKWDDLLRLRTTTLKLLPQIDNEGLQPFTVSLQSESARLRIPFRYACSAVIDNGIEFNKSLKQLVHYHIKGQDDFILEPVPEAAKKLPQIDLDIKMFAIEIQDDPFETRLNIIWRVGYEEQIARGERAVAFEAKVRELKQDEAAPYSAARIDVAYQNLLAYDGTHWIKRMRNAVAEQSRREDALTRRLYGARQQVRRTHTLLPIDLLPPSRSSPLARATFQQLKLVFSKPAAPSLPDFLFDVGKGLPRDTTFTLLVPFHLSWKMEEAKCQLRDYPLPLLHIPPMAGAGHGFASWECETDLVIAEEMGTADAIRRVPCIILPADRFSSTPYTIHVPRSAMTVKSYASPTISISSPYATRISWGNSIQPAVQDVAKVLDSLSKSSPDPSERMGFWDKLRLQFHWRVKVVFAGEGPLHFHLKGARDPYALTGFGAGFSKSWHGNVRFSIGHPNQDREFFQIESDEYIMGIPNLKEYVDNAATGMSREVTETDDRSTQYSAGVDGATGRARFNQDADFIKVCAKFINGVRWGMGTVLERACRAECVLPGCQGKDPFHRQCRMYTFIPHWEVKTKTPDAAPGPDGKLSDSFAGFRSDFIHFSISLISPLVETPAASEDTAGSTPPPLGYNSLHFSPQASTHFWAWWRLFDGSMSLPIRQGKLFPAALPASKKFGKHCATIKYRFSLAPLFISHAYRQESWDDWAEGKTSVVALKGKIGRFHVDIHQREQEEVVLRKPDSQDTKVMLHKVFYKAEVDCDGVDLRVISAIFSEPEKRVVVPTTDGMLDDDSHERSKRNFKVADEDLEWIDLDDFVDSVYTIPDQNPQLQVLPFVKCPRFTYYRQIDVVPHEAGAEAKVLSKFGHEPSHSCLMGCATDTITVQIDAANLRLSELQGLLSNPSPDGKDGSAAEIQLRIGAVERIIARLVKLRALNGQGDHRLHLDVGQSRAAPTAAAEAPAVEDDSDDAHLPHITSNLYQEWGQWENRYMIHNPAIQISNSTRDILLQYYYSSRDRRGFVYHLSTSAIRFIRDLAKEHGQGGRPLDPQRKGSRGASIARGGTFEEVQKTNRLLDELINGVGSNSSPSSASSTSSNDKQPRRSFGDALDVDPASASDRLPDEFDSHLGHLCVFIKPQIALQSDLDDKSIIILTALRAQLKVFSVVDSRVLDDPVNAHVLHQTFATLDGLQAFYPRDQHRRDGELCVPLETMVDLRVEPWGFDRVVPRTSASLRYDKFNQLRMSAKGSHNVAPRSGRTGEQESHFKTGTDRVSVEFDKFSVSANPDHFAAIYNVVTDLLLYSDPLQKSRNNQLEAVVFTHDFSDLAQVVQIVTSLQHRLRSIADLGQQYQVHLDELDDEGRHDLFIGRAEFTRLSYELNLMMLAITRAQDMNGGTTTGNKTAGIQFEARASELVWHMLDHADLPFAKFSVNGVEFSWVSKQDSSTSNSLVIRDLKALNSSPNQVFAEIVSKLEGAAEEHELAKVGVFAAVLWNALAPVGGISIVEQFELHLHPIRLQLEHGVGRKIMDYVFSQRNTRQDTLPAPSEKLALSRPSSQLFPPSSLGSTSANRSTDSLVPPSRPRSARSLSNASSTRPVSTGDASLVSGSNSFASLVSSSTSLVGADVIKFRRSITTPVLDPQRNEEGLDADEMRRRAALNRTFVLIDITPTLLCLTYRSEKADHSRLPDIYNITYKTPSIQYRSKTWSFLDLLDELKKDVIKSVWSQKGALLGQLLQTAHRRLPLHDVRSAAQRSLKSRLTFRPRKSSSPVVIVTPSPLTRTPSAGSSVASGQSTVGAGTASVHSRGEETERAEAENDSDGSDSDLSSNE